jgi:hypothetical protein
VVFREELLTLPEGKETHSKRQYPAVYEKVIPLALGVIAIAIVALLVIIMVVLAGAR